MIPVPSGVRVRLAGGRLHRHAARREQSGVADPRGVEPRATRRTSRTRQPELGKWACLPGLSHRRTARRRGSNKFAADSSLEGAGFEPWVT
jgi:hypothetical protein